MLLACRYRTLKFEELIPFPRNRLITYAVRIVDCIVRFHQIYCWWFLLAISFSSFLSLNCTVLYYALSFSLYLSIDFSVLHLVYIFGLESLLPSLSLP